MQKLQTVSEWIYKLVKINILWILFTLAGGVVFGIGPATVSLHKTVSNWINSEEPSSGTVKYFWHFYKKMFIRANLLWFLIVAAGSVLYVNIYFIFRIESSMAPVLLGVGIASAVFYVTVVLYSFPLMALYGLSLFRSVKYSVIYGLASPVLTLSVVTGAAIIHFFIYQLPVLYLFVSVSAVSYITVSALNYTSYRLKLFQT